MRRHYLVSYDIADDKRRDQVHKTLRDQGNWAQYSVFFCELNRVELSELRGTLHGIINHSEDQVLILDLGLSETPLDRDLECLGKPYDPPTRVRIV